MMKIILWLAGTWALWGGGLLPCAAQAPPQPTPAGLAGSWKGPLAIPGGSLLLQLTISPPGAGAPGATLDLPGKKSTRLPAILAFRGDTVVLNAPTAGVRYVCLPTADGQELRGIWSQPGLRVPLVLHRVAGGSGPAASLGRTGPGRKPTTYHTEPVTIRSQPGNVALAGTLSLPDGPGPYPAAVLLSDMGSQNRDSPLGKYRFFAELSAALARQGIAVLRLDDRGTGQSEGKGSMAAAADLALDAQAALAYLRLRPTLAATHIGLIGHGEGGNVGLLAAATQPLPPSFVVTLAAAGVSGMELLAGQPEPLSSPADTARAGAARRQAWAGVQAQAAKLRASGSNAAQVETYVAQQRLKIKNDDRKQAEATAKFRRTMLDLVRQTDNDDQAQAIVVNMLRQRYPAQDPAVARARAQEVTSPWYRNYLKFNPQSTLGDVRCPVLLLNGTDDAEVNAALNLTAFERGLKGNKNVTSRRLPGVNHWFQTPAAELLAATDGTVDPVISALMLDTVRDWILQQVGP